ncbi:fumarylacetoacetate hydrolase family protein [Sphingomonas flavalba]|uniref:fumarylacetoacetate hydrolase family protein n=1 Tax=Sphingomonas flavalba TaxID=2559804 RepID=UPI0039DF341B
MFTLDPVTIAIEGTIERFPVRRIYCVGRNYADHAREMGVDPDREFPFFFSKPASAVVASGAVLPFPSRTDNLHHEIELVIAIGAAGENVTVADAGALVFGHAAGLDLTRRDLQAAAKAAGEPWDMAKGFDNSAPVGAIVRGMPPRSGRISLSIDGAVRQDSDIDRMIWSVEEIITGLSTWVALAPGDLIFTGTPSGVGPIRRGETVRGEIAGVPPVEVTFAV